jgi:hypothetical protein
MTNEEYRRVIKAKTSELMNERREHEGSTKTNGLKLKELEFSL